MLLDKILPDIQIYLRLIRFIIILSLGLAITRIVLMPITTKLISRRGLDAVKTHSFSNLTAATGAFSSFIFALQAAEFGNLVTVLGAITAALTVAVGFGMRDQISNLVAGFLIYLDNPFIKGDYIKAGDNMGRVKEIKLRHTIIENNSKTKTVLPNSLLTLNPVENFTKGKNTAIRLEFTVTNKNTEKMEEIIKDSIKEEENVLEKPEPQINYLNIDKDGKTTLEAIIHVKSGEQIKNVRNSMKQKISKLAEDKKIFE